LEIAAEPDANESFVISSPNQDSIRPHQWVFIAIAFSDALLLLISDVGAIRLFLLGSPAILSSDYKKRKSFIRTYRIAGEHLAATSGGKKL